MYFVLGFALMCGYAFSGCSVLDFFLPGTLSVGCCNRGASFVLVAFIVCTSSLLHGFFLLLKPQNLYWVPAVEEQGVKLTEMHHMAFPFKIPPQPSFLHPCLTRKRSLRLVFTH